MPISASAGDKPATKYARNRNGDWFKNGRWTRSVPARIEALASYMAMECTITDAQANKFYGESTKRRGKVAR